MTKRDFTLIAAAFNARWCMATPNERFVIEALAKDLCPLFKSENSLFDQTAFMKAVRGE